MNPEIIKNTYNRYLHPENKSNTQETKEHPHLYLINTRLWIDQLSKKYQRPVTVDNIPQKEWQSLFDKYDHFWFMGIYKPSQASQDHAQKWSHQSRYALPDLDPQKDVAASPFAVPDYSPNPLIAKDWKSWDKMVRKLHKNNKKVIIDFVPNHLALDSQLAKNHPEYFIQGNEYQHQSNPDLFFPIIANDEKTYYLAHGKDPNFSAWADTLQLNYGLPEVHQYMGDQLQKLTSHSDGVRCDMAMLLNPNTFLRTWGWMLSDQQKNFLLEHSFWEEKIPLIKNNNNKDFKFIGEIYWDENYLSQYFDYIYDDKFYKKIINSSSDIKNHLAYLIDNKNKPTPCRSVLYIENHDEQRACETLGPKRAKAAAVLAAIVPESMLIVNQGQENGWKIRPPMQISRFPNEDIDLNTQKFYNDLFKLTNSHLFKYGDWKMCHLNQISGDTIALEVTSCDKKLSAIVCLNISKEYSKCTIPHLKKDTPTNIVCLTDEKEITPDTNCQNGMYIGLESGEVQIIYINSIPKNKQSFRYPNITRIFDKI
jgi:hypothetical protein